MLPIKIVEWLRDHGKDDLQECTYEELLAACNYIGLDCPVARYAYQEETDERERL